MPDNALTVRKIKLFSNTKQKLTNLSDDSGSDKRLNLFSPVELPNACGYLWNSDMLIQMNCRGYAVAQFMQPEPAKYSQGPSLEAKTFIQPEHPYFAHHPGRFFYIKDKRNQQLFSVPFEPCRQMPSSFCFSLGEHDIKWQIQHHQLAIELTLTLPINGAAELWSITIENLSDEERELSVYPYFSIGYKSWMNQSADFDPSLNAIVAQSITPYQKVKDYYKNRDLKDMTYLLADKSPTAWSSNQSTFEGWGGLSQPTEVMNEFLSQSKATYEVPVAVLQYDVCLAAGETATHQFVFGAAKDKAEIEAIQRSFFGQQDAFVKKQLAYQEYIAQGKGCLTLDVVDQELKQFTNQWLPRQVFYHGDSNRLTTDPQTRNFLQDNMGLVYINPNKAKQALLTAFSQQHEHGAMPDGILLHPTAELKYINQVPHADHSVWLTICLKAYLDETNESDILHHKLPFAGNDETASVIEHIERALNKLLDARDYRGLSFIEQGDWCDPMNMVGHKGKGVSSWLSLATAYALNCWCEIVQHYLKDYSAETLSFYQKSSLAINQSVNAHCWDGNWYARGITDDNVNFGVKSDQEGRIYLNPQSWALLSGAAGIAKKFSLLNEVERQLNTPYGVMMLAPSYTKMREDVGRLTQKHPGVAENGSIYNHAAAFYAYSLYQVGEYNQAFQVLRKMIPYEADILRRGQLPNFIPNYYRGAYYQLPDHTGRSSQLFNTGTVAWVYRCIIEELVGLKGMEGKLVVNPKLPDCINELTGVRHFLGATFEFSIAKQQQSDIKVSVNGIALSTNIIDDISEETTYQLVVTVPA